MSTNIINSIEIHLNAWINESDYHKILEKYENELPPECFIFDDKKLAPPDKESKCKIISFQWEGPMSGNTYYEIWPDIAKFIKGKLEVAIVWEGGDISGIRVINGMFTETEVILSLVPIT